MKKTLNLWFEGVRKVFSFQPHQTYFLAQMEELFLLDQQVDLEVASLFPLLETAFTLLLDGTPRIGEWVLVLGQGSIGLMLTALLSRTGAFIVSADPSPLKQELSKRFGAMVSLDPYSKSFREECLSLTEGRGFDLIFEISGNPQALNLANSLATFESEIIVGSWYGKKLVNLGTPFHRGRLRLKSSQVSTLPSKLSGHWNKERRSKVVWKLLQEMNAKEVISHRLPLEKGAEAFRLLEDSPVDLIQVVFTL